MLAYTVLSDFKFMKERSSLARLTIDRSMGTQPNQAQPCNAVVREETGSKAAVGAMGPIAVLKLTNNNPVIGELAQDVRARHDRAAAGRRS